MYAYLCYRLWHHDKPEKIVANVWTVMTPFLFGTIGAALKFSLLKPEAIGYALIVVLISIFARGIGT